jgi:sugar phosphate isomerase/epimerase
LHPRAAVSNHPPHTVDTMDDRPNRRHFLTNAALLPLATMTAAQFHTPSASPPPGLEPARERALFAGSAGTQPIKRVGDPALKVALNAYSFSKLLNDSVKRGRGGVDLFQLLDFCAKNNVDGFDPTGYFFPGYPAVPSAEYVNNLKRRAFELGIGISGTGVRNNFTQPDAAKRAADVQHIKEWVEVASRLGAPVLRVFADTQMRATSWDQIAKGHTWDEVAEWIAADLRECTAHAKEHGVIIGVQNHGDFLKTADHVLKLLNLVDSDWCATIVDTGYFKSPDPYVDMARVAPYAVNWQVKESPFGAGSDIRLDLDKFIRLVRASGYRGYLPIETLSAPGKDYDPFKVVPAFLAELRQALAQAT